MVTHFTPIRFCKQRMSRTAALHKEIQRGLCTEKPLHRDFYAKRLLLTEVGSVAESALLLFELLSVSLLPLPDHLPFVFPFPSLKNVKCVMVTLEPKAAHQGVVQDFYGQTRQFARAYVDDVPEDKKHGVFSKRKCTCPRSWVSSCNAQLRLPVR